VGEVIREFQAAIDGHVIARVYASSSQGHWQAWIEFLSLQHGNLSRNAVTRTFPDREAVSEWAKRLDDEELRRALEDAELVSAGELGRTPA
jgi:predicted alpha/beta hydrolase family esterase